MRMILFYNALDYFLLFHIYSKLVYVVALN